MRNLIFDGDASQTTAAEYGGSPCTICLNRPPTLIRIREKVPGGSKELMFVCPNCVGRLFVQVERLGLWKDVSAVVQRAMAKVLGRRNLPAAAQQVNPKALKENS